MKLTGALLLALCLQAAADSGPSAEPRFFHFRAAVQVPGSAEGRACAVLDPRVFTHSKPTLTDLRLYAGTGASAAEVPYVITESKSTLEPSDPAKVLNLGMHGEKISFDLQMPARAYTEVQLLLAGKDFLATAQVWGEESPAAAQSTSLGQFTLFDLSGQHLSRNLRLPLSESSFPFLHIELAVSGAPGFRFTPTSAIVIGAQVPPNLEAQTLYTPVASTTAFAQRGRATLAAIDLPAQVPVERIRFAMKAGDRTSFSRLVRIAAKPAQTTQALAPERLDGVISRVHLPPRGGQAVLAESLTVPATLGINLQRPAVVEITVENGDDRPIPLLSATLEMRQRKLCFNIPATGEPLELYYGDPVLSAPVYDYARLFNPADSAETATLGPEESNPGYTARPLPPRSFTERHPRLLWLVLLAVVAALGFVALRQGKSSDLRP